MKEKLPQIYGQVIKSAVSRLSCAKIWNGWHSASVDLGGLFTNLLLEVLNVMSLKIYLVCKLETHLLYLVKNSIHETSQINSWLFSETATLPLQSSPDPG